MNDRPRHPTARELVKARQRRQKELPIEPAGKKPTAKAPAGKEPTVARKPAATAVARADNRRYIDRYLDTVDPVTIPGRIIRFKDGAFYTKDDGEEVSKDTVFVALVDQLLVGYCKFNGPNQQPDRIMGLLFDGFEPPEKEDLPDRDENLWEEGLDGQLEDPWGEHNYLPLQDVESDELFCFVTHTKTGRRAVARLVRHYKRLRGTQPGHVPLVWLRTGGFEHREARVGFVVTPQFVACGSRPADSTVKPDTSTAGILDDEIPDFEDK